MAYAIKLIECEWQAWDEEQGPHGDTWVNPYMHTMKILATEADIDKQLDYYCLPSLSDWDEIPDFPGEYSFCQIEDSQDREKPGAQILCHYRVVIVTFSDPEPYVRETSHA
jgi:hypothetical protein